MDNETRSGRDVKKQMLQTTGDKELWRLPTKNKVQQQNGLKITGSKLNVYQMLHLSPNGLLILSISIKE